MPRRARHTNAILAALTAAAFALPAQAQVRLPPSGTNIFGMPGVLDMPTATRFTDGLLAFTAAIFPGTWRATFAFQALPRVTLSFRYAAAQIGLAAHGGIIYDRSFDLHWQITDEGRYLPALALGLRDFLGTGVYSGEYLVATRTINPRLRASLGIGWGRLGTHGSFTNPLAAISDDFRVRPDRRPGDRGGTIPFHRFFRGPAAVFAGLEYQATERLTLLAEYSSDAYPRETTRGGMRWNTPVNLGFRYQYSPSTSFSGYVLYGANVGLQASFALNPAQPGGGPVRVGAPLPIRHRPAAPPAGGFDTSWVEASAVLAPRLREALGGAMQAEGLRLEDIRLEAQRAIVRFTNERHEVLPRAIGRTARVLTYGLPESVEEIVLIPMHGPVPGSAVVLSRGDLERLEHRPDGAAELLARSRFADATGFPGVGRFWQPAPPDRPRFSWSLGPYVRASYFDPNAPLRADLGLQADLAYAFAENLSVNASLTQRIWGNIDGTPIGPPSPGYPRVRTTAALYSSDRPTVERLTLDYTMRPGRDLFGRVTLGWIERMYAGVSTELLWSPADSRLALGIELNAVEQRDPVSLLGLNGLRRITGHVSAYYDFGGGYMAQLDVGQYLAGDRGATLRVQRTFANGISVGAWATLTDMPFRVFGEGSFDKGLTLTIPFAALLGQPSTGRYSTMLRSINRDGGAMLSVPGRLYPTIRESRAQALRLGWGAVLQ